MKVESISDASAYKLDYVKTENTKIAALTKKNAEFIEGALILDSNYRRESLKLEPDKKFDLHVHSSNANGFYCGSASYWFDELKNGNRKYEDCILGAVISIDRSNSTHLETTEKGRVLMQERIVKICDNKDSLINELKRKLEPSDHTHLFARMLDPNDEPRMTSIKDGSLMYYLSFVSKFCSEAACWLLGEWLYSKYDNVVSEYLPTYYQLYTGKKRYKADYQPKKTGDAEKDFDNRLNVYDRYCKDIEEILTVLRDENGIELNKNEIDHIIWYGMKGK